MLIDTTINIQTRAYRRLCKASNLRRPRRLVISWLIRKLGDERNRPPVSLSRIRYQERDEEKNWEKAHLYLSPAEYELFQDLKKVYKMSGSFLIAYAIEKYLNEMLRVNHQNPDNYRITCYGLSLRIVKGILCWTQYWGMPPHLLRELRPHPR
jgi:hypothetical protein